MILLISISIIVLIISFIFKIDNIFSFKTFASLFPYYILGLFSNKFRNDFSKYIYNFWPILIPIFLVSAYFWQRNDSIDINFSYSNSKIFIFGYKLFVATLGIFITMGIFKQIKNFNQVILYVGINTLPIYAMNWYFIEALKPLTVFFIGSYIYIYICIFIISISIILFSLLSSTLIKKNKLLSLLLLGNR